MNTQFYVFDDIIYYSEHGRLPDNPGISMDFTAAYNTKDYVIVCLFVGGFINNGKALRASLFI